MAGDAARAVEVSRDYMRADPFAPVTANGWLGAAHYLLKDYSRAREILSDCVARMPLARFGGVFLAATCAQLGEMDRARAEVAEVLRLEPASLSRGCAGCSPVSSSAPIPNTTGRASSRPEYRSAPVPSTRPSLASSSRSRGGVTTGKLRPVQGKSIESIKPRRGRRFNRGHATVLICNSENYCPPGWSRPPA